jgi:hypothetical protein
MEPTTSLLPGPARWRRMSRSFFSLFAGIAAACLITVGAAPFCRAASPGGSTVVLEPAPPPPQGPFPPPPPEHVDPAAPAATFFTPDEPPWGTLAAEGQPVEAPVRRFSFTAAIGPGLLVGPGERDLAMSYQLFRVGLGLDPRLTVVLGWAGVGTNSVNPATDRDSWLKQDLWSAGLQALVLPRLYLRGALGLALVSESVGELTFKGGRGLATEGAIGYELLQRRHVAVAVELNGSFSHYARESWKTAGLQLSVSLF